MAEWRKISESIIKSKLSAFVKANPDATENEKRKILRDAYPFGERRNHPYKIWCDCVRRALGNRKPAPEPPPIYERNQGRLFNEQDCDF